LIQERKRLIDEKGRKQRERKQEALDKKQKEEDAIVAEQNRVEDEKKQKAGEKVLREKEKKLVRKAKQAFKRYVSAALEELEQKEYALEDEVDLICIELNRLKLTKFNSQLDSKPAPEVVAIVKTRAKNIQDGVEEDEEEDEQPEPSSLASNGSDCKTTMDSSGETANGISNKEANGSSSSTKKKLPFTKEEMSALAKGVKKFPAGGGNRWDQISNYINNVCRPDDPRTKEECIEIFNKVNKAGKPLPNGNTSHAETTTTSTDATDASDVWNSEQDQQLQKGLTMFPSSIEKNERWSSISDEVTGKSKKECVARFKAIRDALKAKK
jgi:DnaJ family protein C protein 2